MPTRKKTNAKKAENLKKTTRGRTPATSGSLRQRILGPIAGELGEALAPLGKPTGDLLVDLGNRAIQWIRTTLPGRLERIPEDQRVPPNPRIAVPAIQALTYSFDDELIRELFANLLEGDLRSDPKRKVHPAFVEAIKQMTPLDANVLWVLATDGPQAMFLGRVVCGAQSKDIGHTFSFLFEGVAVDEINKSADNLIRLGFLEKRFQQHPKKPRIVDQKSAIYEFLKARHGERITDPSLLGGMSSGEIRVFAMGLYLTLFGADFATICLKEETMKNHAFKVDLAPVFRDLARQEEAEESNA
jgi:hypothetical protein